MGDAPAHRFCDSARRYRIEMRRRSSSACWSSCATGMALWSAHGKGREGWPRYRALLDAARRDLLALGAHEIVLANTIGLMQALDAWVFQVALADRRSNADPEVRQRPAAPVSSAAAGSRSAVRSPGIHRQPAALGLDDAVRNAGARARPVHDRRREPPADRGRAAAQPAVARLRIQSPVRRGCDTGDGGNAAAPFLRSAAGPRGPAAGAGSARADAGEDAEELAAGAVPRARFPRGAFHLPVSRSAAGALEHDRSVDDRAFSHLSAAARLDRRGVVVVARAGLARADRTAAARDRGGAMECSDTAADRRPRGVAGRAAHDRALRRAARRSRQPRSAVCTRPPDSSGTRQKFRLRLSQYTVSPPDADKWRRHAAEIEAVLPSLAEQIARAERFAAR